MTAEKLFKEFLKFYNTMNPMGMGASKAKEIKVGYPTQDGMHYPDYDENASQTLPAVYDPDAPDPDYEQELYESGDSFSGNIEKRVAAAQAIADKVKGGVSDLATRFATGAGLRDKQLAKDAAGFIGMTDEELSGMDPIEYERPEVTGLSIEEDAEDFNSKPDIGGIDSSDFEQEELYGDPDPLDFSYPAERSLGDYGREDKENSDAEASMRADMKMQKKAARKAKRKGKGGYVDPQGGEPLITTDAGRTIEKTGAPARTPTLEELKAVAGDNQDMFGTGPEDGPEDPPETVPDYFLGTGDMRRKGEGVPDYRPSPLGVDVSNSPRAEVISENPEDYTDKAIELFYNTHGGPFNPKSREDRAKLEKMKSLLAEMGGMGEMTENQFALQFYRRNP